MATPPLRSEKPQSSAYDKKDTHIHTGKSSASTNNVGRVEDKFVNGNFRAL